MTEPRSALRKAAKKRFRLLRQELSRLHKALRNGDVGDEGSRLGTIRTKEKEYREAFAECERIYAKECMTEIETERALLLKRLEDLKWERASVLKGWLPIRLTPQMKASSRTSQGLEILEKASERGDRLAHKELGMILRNALWHLLFRAMNGDEKAFRLLLALLTSCIEQLHSLNQKQPEMVKRLAEHRTNWPGFLSVDPDVKQMNARIMKFLPLGNRVMANFKGKTWSRRIPENRAVLHLMEELMKNRNKLKRLGPLNRQNYVKWWKAAEPLLERCYGNNYEDHKEFARNWKSEAYKEPQPHGVRTLKSNARALIRRDIKRKIKQAFHSIAPKAV